MKTRRELYKARKQELVDFGLCVFCGRPVVDDSVFCGKCRAKTRVEYWTKAALQKYPELRNELRNPIR